MALYRIPPGPVFSLLVYPFLLEVYSWGMNQIFLIKELFNGLENALKWLSSAMSFETIRRCFKGLLRPPRWRREESPISPKPLLRQAQRLDRLR